MTEIRKNPLRTIAAATALLLGSGSVLACTGERPSFSDEVTQPVEADPCEGDQTFNIPVHQINGDEPPSYSSTYTHPNEVTRRDRYDLISEDFRKASSLEEIEEAGVRWFEEFGIKFHNGELPTTAQQDGYSHQPEKITPDLLKISVRNAFRDSLDFPDPLLASLGESGLEVYYTFGLTDEQGAVIPSLLYPADPEKLLPARLIIGVDPSIDSGENFRWGVTEALIDSGCAPDHESFVSLNPPGFTYGDEIDFSKRYLSFKSSAATESADADLSETYRSVLRGDDARGCNPTVDQHQEPVGYYGDDLTKSARCDKWRLVIRRLALIDTKSAEELALKR